MADRKMLVMALGAVLMAGLLVISSLGQNEREQEAVSDEQISAGLGVLQNSGNPGPVAAATTVKGSKSNSDNITSNSDCADALGPTVPASNVTESGKPGQAGGPVTMATNLNLSKSNVNRSANLNLSKSNINIAAPSGAQRDLSVGTITLPTAMAFKQAPEKKDQQKRIAAGEYCVGLLTLDDYEDQVLALFAAGSNVAAEEVLSLNAQALSDAISDEFTDGQGIPCLLSDEYTAAILLNYVVAQLAVYEETATSVDLSIEKSLDGELRSQQIAAYTLTLKNNGASATDGTINVTDTLPPSLSLQSTSGTGWSCTGFLQAISCTRTTSIDAGQSSTIQIIARVNAAGGASVTNCAQVTFEGDSNSENNRSCHSTQVQGGSDT